MWFKILLRQQDNYRNSPRKGNSGECWFANSVVFVTGAWISVSNRKLDFEFLEIYSGFQSPVFQTPQAKISRFPDSRVPDAGSLTKATDIKSFCFSNLKNLLKFSEFHPQPSTKYIGQGCTLTNDMTNHVQRVPSSWKWQKGGSSCTSDVKQTSQHTRT